MPQKQLREIAVDVSASGQSGILNLGGAAVNGAAFYFELQTLVGGSTPDVTPKVEHSPDAVVWFDLEASWTALTAAGTKTSLKTGPIFPFVRFDFVTTGGPSSATADMTAQGGS